LDRSTAQCPAPDGLRAEAPGQWSAGSRCSGGAGPEELTDEVAEQILAAIEVAAPDSLIEPSARTGRAPQLSFAF